MWNNHIKTKYGKHYPDDIMVAEQYDKLCKNKDTKIHMPKMKVDEETDIIIFTNEQMKTLSKYFKGTNAETVFLLG